MLVALSVNVYSSHRYLLHKEHNPEKYATYFAQRDDEHDELDDVVLDTKETEEIPMVAKKVERGAVIGQGV